LNLSRRKACDDYHYCWRLDLIDLLVHNLLPCEHVNVVVSLSSLKYLSVAGCRNVDDWCLDRFVQFRDSLVFLDVSRCPLVTERGLATLHKLQSVCFIVCLLLLFDYFYSLCVSCNVAEGWCNGSDSPFFMSLIVDVERIRPSGLASGRVFRKCCTSHRSWSKDSQVTEKWPQMLYASACFMFYHYLLYNANVWFSTIHYYCLLNYVLVIRPLPALADCCYTWCAVVCSVI